MSWLKELRTTLGCTQKDIADLLEISTSLVSMVETGDRNLPAGLTGKLMDLLQQLDLPANTSAVAGNNYNARRVAKRNSKIIYRIRDLERMEKLTRYKLEKLRKRKQEKDECLKIVETVLPHYKTNSETETDPIAVAHFSNARNRKHFCQDELDVALMEFTADIYKYKAEKLAAIAEKFGLKDGREG